MTTMTIRQLATRLKQPEQNVIDQVNRMNKKRRRKIKNDTIEERDGVIIGQILTLGYSESRAKEVMKMMEERKKYL